MDTEKIKVSPFEYAIKEAVKVSDLDKYRPATNDEIEQDRINKAKDFASKIKVKGQ
jgi:hypothetical protein